MLANTAYFFFLFLLLIFTVHYTFTQLDVFRTNKKVKNSTPGGRTQQGHSSGLLGGFEPAKLWFTSYLALVTPGAGRQPKGLFKGEQRALPSVSTGSPVSGSPGETAAGRRPRVLYLLTVTERCPPPSPKMTNERLRNVPHRPVREPAGPPHRA